MENEHDYDSFTSGEDETFSPEEIEVNVKRNNRSKNKIRMPFGAIVACILSIALLIGVSAASVNLISSGISDVRERIAVNTNMLNSEHETAQHSVVPQETAKVSTGTENPSDSLQYASSPVASGDEYTIIQNSMNAVVSIDVMTQSGYSTVTAGSGSGVIITSDGYIVTCNHVVEKANKIYVYLNDGSSCEAELVGRDIINDLAVIKINGSDLPYAVLGDSSTLKVGEGVFAIGNALGELSNTYTSGVISGLDRVLKVKGQEMTLLQTDAAINHGNSGGGLFRKADGSLIGIVNAKSAGEDIEGLGFAIPSTVVVNIVHDLMDYGFVTGRPYLGVSTEDVTLSGYGFFTNYYTYPQIVRIEENSPAASSELKENDIILSIDGISVSGTDSLVRTLNSYNIGDTVTLTVLRDRTSMDIQITLGERAVPAE